MNTQLFAHLETFDSDEEYSEYHSLNEDDDDDFVDGAADSADPASARALKGRVKKFVKPKSTYDVLLKLLTMLPIGIALGEYIGLFRSMSLCLIAFVFLQLRPPPSRHKNRPTATTTTTPLPSAGMIGKTILRRRSSVASTSNSSCGGDSKGRRRSSNRNRTKGKPQLSEDTMARLGKINKQVNDCRKEVSRLLGLIGAQPLEWKEFDAAEMSDIVNECSSEGGDGQPLSASCCITDVACISVVKFLEAHVQFLLTLDHAYYWMKITTSLHLGLGPQSQCAERVERAAIAKEFRNRRRRSITASLIEEGVSSPLEAQRKLDSSSILSLSSARRHLARAIVDQSDSLARVYRQIHSEKRKFLEQYDNHNGNDEAGTTDHEDVILLKIDKYLLEMPHVVDLAWIKASRQRLGTLLSVCVDQYCTIDCLRTLSEELAPRSKLDGCMWNARNSREYLICNLLLGKETSARPLAGTNSSKSDEELMLSLLQYRQQLDALGATLWSCQHYLRDISTGFNFVGTTQYLTVNSGNNAPTASEILQREEDAAGAKVKWWKQVKEMSATCQALEKDIEDRHFSYVMVESAVDVGEVQDSLLGGGLQQSRMAAESGSYEHENSDVGAGKHLPKQDVVSSNKVLVFSGKGSVVKSVASSTNRSIARAQTRADGSAYTPTPLPERDNVCEQLLVRELQNRIRAMASLEEQEQMDDVDEEPIIDDQVNSVGITGAGSKKFSHVTNQTAEPVDTIDDGVSDSSSPSSRDLEATPSLFLSFLEEQEHIMDDLDQEPIMIGRVNMGTEGSGEKHMSYFNDQNATNVDTIDESVSGSASSSCRDLEVTTSLFLGATGSLLSELKERIATTEDNYEHVTDDDGFIEECGDENNEGIL